MKSFVALFAVLALGTVIATAAFAAAPRHASVVIRHEVKHCHAWSLGSGPFAARIDTKLAVGGSITFKNIDVMPHRLIEKSGPHAVFAGSPSMSHMAASVKVTFPRAGTYRFTTKAGEDYMAGVKTIGEDNVLALTVTVR
jgi:plastocyanin